MSGNITGDLARQRRRRMFSLLTQDPETLLVEYRAERAAIAELTRQIETRLKAAPGQAQDTQDKET